MGESQPTTAHVSTTESPTCAATQDPGEMSTVNGFSEEEKKNKKERARLITDKILFLLRHIPIFHVYLP